MATINTPIDEYDTKYYATMITAGAEEGRTKTTYSESLSGWQWVVS